MYAIICGGRDYHIGEDGIAWLDAMHTETPFDLVVTGGAKGADHKATWWAMSRGIDVVVFMANWKKRGRKAGPFRNRKMAEYISLMSNCHFDGNLKRCAVIAFPGGKGTAHMIQVAQDCGFHTFSYPKQ